MEKKKEKIRNENYNKFLKEGMITLLDQEDIKKALDNVRGKYKTEGRALLIAAYATGARPNEILKIKAKDVFKAKTGNSIIVKLQASKNGLPREMIFSPRRLALIKELYTYARSVFVEQLLFYHFRDNYIRHKTLKSGETRQYIEISNKLRYHFNIWFENVIDGSIPPYYLRHNRFSKMIKEGANLEQIRLIKGAKTVASVYPYVHMSKDIAKKASKFID
jgi:site-specific recombinase XerD